MLKTEDYHFFIREEQLYVKFKGQLDQNLDPEIVNLEAIVPEIIGVTKNDHELKWTVGLITSNNIKKLEVGVTHMLEVFGFNFASLNEALKVQAFLINHMMRDVGDD